MENDKSCTKLASETEVDVFKKPLPLSITKKNIKTEILDEEIYLNEIGKIIQRDFFPDLEKLKAQNAYLEALEHNDISKLREIYSKYSIDRNLPADTCSSPATFETPIMKKIESSDVSTVQSMSDDKNDEISNSQMKAEKRKSLDVFLKCYTSEDNQSFEELILDSEIKQRLKYPWLYKDETTGKSGNLMLPTIEEQLKLKDKPTNIDTWTYKNKNYIMYVPDGVGLSKEERLEMIKKNREINYANTRLKESPFSDEQNKETLQCLAQSQIRTLEGKIGVDGKELTLSDTPKVNGYNFVKTPSPMPGVNESPLMTWGQIEGTPFRLDGSDTPLRQNLLGPSFKINEPPVREKLAHALAEKVCEKNRDQKLKALEVAKRQLAMSSPSVTSSPFERFDLSSPALTNNNFKNRINSDATSRSVITPKHLLSSPKAFNIKSSNTSAINADNSEFITNNSLSDNQSLTDDLLNLNVAKRPRAADYFV